MNFYERKRRRVTLMVPSGVGGDSLVYRSCERLSVCAKIGCHVLEFILTIALVRDMLHVSVSL